MLRRSGLVRGDGVDVEDGAEEVLDDLSLSLLASLLDALDLLLGFLVGLGLGLLVALAVLYNHQYYAIVVVDRISRRWTVCLLGGSIVPRPRISYIRLPSWPCSRLSLAWPHRERP